MSYQLGLHGLVVLDRPHNKLLTIPSGSESQGFQHLLKPPPRFNNVRQLSAAFKGLSPSVSRRSQSTQQFLPGDYPLKRRQMLVFFPIMVMQMGADHMRAYPLYGLDRVRFYLSVARVKADAATFGIRL